MTRDTCCCRRGAARGEEPHEFPCFDCPRHPDALFRGDDLRCRRHQRAPATRATSLSPPERFVLDQWAEQVASAFGYGFPVLVGSVARAERHWRDVDVRLVLDPEAFIDVTGDDPERHAALNVALSSWGRQVTGLPIDFQFQPDGEDHEGPRYPLGIAVKGDVYRHAHPNGEQSEEERLREGIRYLIESDPVRYKRLRVLLDHDAVIPDRSDQ